MISRHTHCNKATITERFRGRGFLREGHHEGLEGVGRLLGVALGKLGTGGSKVGLCGSADSF